jgi:hypothetical protein
VNVFVTRYKLKTLNNIQFEKKSTVIKKKRTEVLNFGPVFLFHFPQPSHTWDDFPDPGHDLGVVLEVGEIHKKYLVENLAWSLIINKGKAAAAVVVRFPWSLNKLEQPLCPTRRKYRASTTRGGSTIIIHSQRGLFKHIRTT